MYCTYIGTGTYDVTLDTSTGYLHTYVQYLCSRIVSMVVCMSNQTTYVPTGTLLYVIY